MSTKPQAPREPILTYGAAKQLLEQAGVKFGVAYTSETEMPEQYDAESDVREDAARARRKSRASKSQLRRAGQG